MTTGEEEDVSVQYDLLGRMLGLPIDGGDGEDVVFFIIAVVVVVIIGVGVTCHRAQHDLRHG